MAKLLILFRLVPFRSISYRRLGPGFHPHPNLLPSREKGSGRLHGNDGRGLNPGPIWPCLASFTPTVEAGNGATVASFGTPPTRTRWASRPWLWPWLASSGVTRSGETFNSVAFGCISLLSCRLRGNEGGAFRSGQPLIQSHLVAFLTVYAGWGFTLILTFSPQGRRDLTACAGTTGEGSYGESLPALFRSEGGVNL